MLVSAHILLMKTDLFYCVELWGPKVEWECYQSKSWNICKYYVPCPNTMPLKKKKKERSLTTEYILYNLCVNRNFFFNSSLKSGVYSHKCVTYFGNIRVFRLNWTAKHDVFFNSLNFNIFLAEKGILYLGARTIRTGLVC